MVDNERTIRVSWYSHDCEWITKYCDEYHRVSADVPVSVLEQFNPQPVVYADPDLAYD